MNSQNPYIYNTALCLIALCCCLSGARSFASNTLTPYDDFNDNVFNADKWLVEPAENNGAVTVDNGSLNVSGEFYQGQGVQAFLLGPDKAFDALEAKIKLSSETELAANFGIVATLWSDGLFDYIGAMYFTRLYEEDPLVILCSVYKAPGHDDSFFVYNDKRNSFIIYNEALIVNAAYDTWYRMRIALDNAHADFYVKEGNDDIGPEDLKGAYAIHTTMQSSASNLLYLYAWNNCLFETTALSGSVDDIFVGNERPTYTIAGKVEGTLCDNATIAIYSDSAFPLQTAKVHADGTYAFRSLRDQKTYSVGSAGLCCPLTPEKRTVAIQGADQTDINFTAWADNASAETLYAITGGRLIDGNGGRPVTDSLIIVQGDTIRSVSRAGETEIPSGALVIDAAGKTIIPGLHDMHVHCLFEAEPRYAPLYEPKESVGVEYQKHLYAFLFCGVTSVLDVGSFTREDLIFSLRQQERENCLFAPRIFTAGAGIGSPHGYPPTPKRVASSPEEAVQVINDLAKKKPDMVKIFYENENDVNGKPYPTFDTETLKALIDESHRLGLKTTVHVLNSDLATALAPLQPDAFAHLPMTGFMPVTTAMIKNNTSCTPTLMLWTVTVNFFLNPDCIHDDFITACTDPRLISAYKDPELLKTAEQYAFWFSTHYRFPQRYGMVRKLFKAGNKIIMGSDCGGPPGVFHGPSSHEEMGLYVKAGLTPLQAITTATRNGAEFLDKLDRQGTIEAGKLADLVILKADPSKDISNTKKIALVMKGGEIMDRGMLSRDITGRLCEEARYMADRIDLIPVAALKDGDAENKTTLTGQIEQVYTLLKQADDNATGPEGYAQAAQMLADDLLPLLDGCENGSTADDLVGDCAYQKEVYAAALQLGDDCLRKGTALQ